jgi:hypothetical protein
MGLKWLFPVVFAYNFVYDKLGQHLAPGLVGVQHSYNLTAPMLQDADERMTFLPMFLAPDEGTILAPDLDEVTTSELSFDTMGTLAETVDDKSDQKEVKEDDNNGFNLLVLALIGCSFLLSWCYLSYKH